MDAHDRPVDDGAPLPHVLRCPGGGRRGGARGERRDRARVVVQRPFLRSCVRDRVLGGVVGGRLDSVVRACTRRGERDHDERCDERDGSLGHEAPPPWLDRRESRREQRPFLLAECGAFGVSPDDAECGSAGGPPERASRVNQVRASWRPRVYGHKGEHPKCDRECGDPTVHTVASFLPWLSLTPVSKAAQENTPAVLRA